METFTVPQSDAKSLSPLHCHFILTTNLRLYLPITNEETEAENEASVTASLSYWQDG